MNKPRQLDIAHATTQPNSPEHKRFKTLLGKIEKARARLLAWQQQLPVFAQMHEAQAAPLLTELRAARRAFAFELDALHGARRWSRNDSATLSQVICDLCGAMLSEAEAPDDALKALYNRHAEVDFDSEEQQHLASMKALFETMGGIDLGDEPVASADELLRRAQQQMAGAAQAQAQAPHTHPPSRKKTRQTAAQQRAEADAQRISQTVRDVYRKLASALHPDRAAAGTPASERDARTALMQRANQAYEAGDLLALLELQLQTEQIDIAHAAGIAAEQVRHFNKVLAEQLRELEAEIDGRQAAFCGSYGVLVESRINPDELGLWLQDEVRELKGALLQLKGDSRRLQGEPEQLKRLIKRWRADERLMALDDDPFF